MYLQFTFFFFNFFFDPKKFRYSVFATELLYVFGVVFIRHVTQKFLDPLLSVEMNLFIKFNYLNQLDWLNIEWLLLVSSFGVEFFFFFFVVGVCLTLNV